MKLMRVVVRRTKGRKSQFSLGERNEPVNAVMGRSNETIKIYPNMKNEQRTGCPKSHCAKVWAYC